MPPGIIVILTVENDLHALVVRDALSKLGKVRCHIVETDRVCGSDGFVWSTEEDRFPATIRASDGAVLPIRDIDVIWWRRFNVQKTPPYLSDPAHIDLINHDCATSLLGALVNEFAGVWVNHPRATRAAENKLLQLKAAQSAGFDMPRTLVSNDAATAREFCARLSGNVIVKTIRGTSHAHLLTRPLSEEHLQADSLRLSPAMFQERIDGDRHLRIHCFGEDMIAAEIESSDLDWRENLDVPIRPFKLPAGLKTKLRKILCALDLRMGVVDLKLRETGSPVWLEINPQGQFLFIEGTADIQLSTHFARFLCRQIKKRE